MSDDTEDVVIILSPVWAGPAVTPSIQVKASCGCVCWMGAAMAASVAVDPRLQDTKTLCLYHVPRDQLAKAFGGEIALTTVPGIKEEIAEALGQEEADRIWAQFNVQDIDG